MAMRPANHKLNEMAAHHTVSALGTSMESLFSHAWDVETRNGSIFQKMRQQISILSPAPGIAMIMSPGDEACIDLGRETEDVWFYQNRFLLAAIVSCFRMQSFP